MIKPAPHQSETVNSARRFALNDTTGEVERLGSWAAARAWLHDIVSAFVTVAFLLVTAFWAAQVCS